MISKIKGSGGIKADVDGEKFRAINVALKPLDHSITPGGALLGHYSLGALSGIIPAALTADSEIFQFRWNPTDTTKLCVIQKLLISAAITTTFFAAGVPVSIQLFKSTAWTAAGTGGTAIAPAALHKKRTEMGSSLIASGDIRVATTAALGAGTKTLEGESMAEIVAAGPVTNSLAGQFIGPGYPLFEADLSKGEHPIVLASKEGLSVVVHAVPGTGTWQAAFTVDWAELASY